MPQNRLPRPGKKSAVATAVAAILAAVFAVEGGYVNDPADPGGATNFGVTERVARQHGYRGDMQDLKRDCEVEDEICAESIYFTDYIENPGFLPILEADSVVAEELIDTAVNMGPARPSRWFQHSVNLVCSTTLEIDGKVGERTQRAWKDCRETIGPFACVAVINRMDTYQEAEYDRLVRINPRLGKFRRGWQNHRIGNVDWRRCSLPTPGEVE